MFARKLFSTVALASVFALAVPTIAFADESAADGRSEAGREHGKGKGHGQAFPMPAATFQEHVDQRIAHLRERITARLDKRNATPEKKREVMADVDAAEATMRAEVANATKDGTVTKDEATKVHAVAKELRAKYLKGKSKGKAPGKGKGKGKGQK